MKIALVVALACGARIAAADGPTCASQSWADPWPYLDRPADPWLAVANGKPRPVSLPKDRAGMRRNASRAICDAAHDHCLRDCTWLLIPTPTTRRATLYHVAPDGKFFTHEHDPNPQPGFVAYRTVPVTRKNLAKGMRAAALMGAGAPLLDGGGHQDTDGRATLENGYWDVGIVESIDWDRNFVRFEGVRDPYFLTGTRVVVLEYVDGGKVTKLDGVDARAPAPNEVYVAPVLGASDPWSQVKAKQPIASSDTSKLANVPQDCSPARDHCLRSWVWFVTVDGAPVPARWNGKTFVHATDPDRVIEKPGMAYRTRPARENELVANAKVIVYDSPTRPSGEAAAHHWRAWGFATIESADRATRKVNIAGSTNRPFDNVRIMVLWWMPGEDAEAVQ